MDQTTEGNNFVGLAEPRGRGKQEDHLFCIVIRHGENFALLIPRVNSPQPWKEVEFTASNWSKKRPRKQLIK